MIDIATFSNEGPQQYKSPKVIPREFEASFVMEDRSVIKPSKEYRKVIWNWWYTNRADELTADLILRACHQARAGQRA